MSIRIHPSLSQHPILREGEWGIRSVVFRVKNITWTVCNNVCGTDCRKTTKHQFEMSARPNGRTNTPTTITPCQWFVKSTAPPQLLYVMCTSASCTHHPAINAENEGILHGVSHVTVKHRHCRSRPMRNNVTTQPAVIVDNLFINYVGLNTLVTLMLLPLLGSSNLGATSDLLRLRACAVVITLCNVAAAHI